MSSNPFIFLLCLSDTKAKEPWRIESQFMKNRIWWHPLLNHVRNHFETWQICIVFRRLVVFEVPCKGRDDFLSYPSFCNLHDSSLTSLSMVTCDAGYECISAFIVLACLIHHHVLIFLLLSTHERCDGACRNIKFGQSDILVINLNGNEIHYTLKIHFVIHFKV